MDQPGLSPVELEVLEAVLYQQRHSGNPDRWEGAWFGPVGVHVRQERNARPEDDVEEEVIKALDELNRKAYLVKVGETKDGAKFPLYRVTAAGADLIEG